MLQRIWTLVIKEFLALLRDKKARIVLIVPPITQLFIFAFAATLDVKNVPIGIFNQDRGHESLELIERFRGSPMFTKILFLNSQQEIAPFIDEQKAVMVVSIDQQFTKNLKSKKAAPVQFILDGRKSNTAQIVAGYASTILDQYNKDFAKNNQVTLQTSELVPRNWFNPNLIYYWFNVPSLCGILTMVVVLVTTALSIAREREMGTFDQLLVSPLSPLEILIGKALPPMLIGFLEGILIVFVATVLFKIPFTGSFWLLFLGLLFFIAAVNGIGLFISSLCQTQQQAVLGTFVFMAPAVILSGFATPIENMPSWLQVLTYADPLRYMMVIARGVFLKAMPFDVVWSNTWPLAIIAAFTLTAASWFFRKRLE